MSAKRDNPEYRQINMLITRKQYSAIKRYGDNLRFPHTVPHIIKMLAVEFAEECMVKYNKQKPNIPSMLITLNETKEFDAPQTASPTADNTTDNVCSNRDHS